MSVLASSDRCKSGVYQRNISAPHPVVIKSSVAFSCFLKDLLHGKENADN